MSHPSSPSERTYVNPGSVIGTAVTFIALGIVVVAGRLTVRRLKRASVGPDDWFALAALFFTILYSTTHIVGVAVHTEGYHTPPAPHGSPPVETALPPVQARFKKVEYVLNLTFVLVIGSIRLSVLYLYRRIFRGRAFDISWSIVVVITFLWTAIFFFVCLFQCGTDFSASWGSFADIAEHCIDVFHQGAALAITDVTLDVTVLVLPLPFVWKLQMPLRQKLGVSFIFLLGLFSVAAGLTRMVMQIDINILHRPSDTSPVFGLRADDTIGIIGFTLFWQLVQTGVALIASNLLTLRPLYQSLWADGPLCNLSSRFSSSLTPCNQFWRSCARFNDRNSFDESMQGFGGQPDSETYGLTMPLHTLRKSNSTVPLEPDHIRVRTDVSTILDKV